MFLTTGALLFGVTARLIHKISHDMEVVAALLSRRVLSIEWYMIYRIDNEVNCSLSVGPKFTINSITILVYFVVFQPLWVIFF